MILILFWMTKIQTGGKVEKIENMRKEYDIRQPWIMQRADPYVYRHTDGTYYFTASIPEYDCIALRHAEHLLDLADAPETVVWHKHESGIMSEHVWAPELHYLDGKWYIYFAAGEKDDIWEIRPYVLECADEDPMTGTWRECGKIQAAEGDEFSFQAFSLDATVFENAGRRYLVWAEKVGVGKQISNLYIAEMETPTKLKTAQVLLTSPDYDWERGEFWVNEGPFALKRGGKIYLTYSASDTGISYCVGMLSIDESADPLDPRQWKKERCPVLRTDESLEIYGPGHNCFTEDEDGNTIMVFHARKTKELMGNPLYVPNRHAMLLKVQWDADGKPVFPYCF